MKTLKVMDTKLAMVAAGVIGVLIIGYIIQRQAKQSAETVVNAINPANDNNIFNQGVLSIGRAVTGDKNWTLGGKIYDWTH